MYKGYDAETFAAIIRANSITHVEFTEFCGLSRGALNNTINGKGKNNPRTLFFYSLALDKLLEELMKDGYTVFSVTKEEDYFPKIYDDRNEILRIANTNKIPFEKFGCAMGITKATKHCNYFVGDRYLSILGRKNVEYCSSVLNNLLKEKINSDGYIFIPYPYEAN